jgi:hypothetical protein
MAPLPSNTVAAMHALVDLATQDPTQPTPVFRKPPTPGHVFKKPVFRRGHKTITFTEVTAASLTDSAKMKQQLSKLKSENTILRGVNKTLAHMAHSNDVSYYKERQKTKKLLDGIEQLELQLKMARTILDRVEVTVAGLRAKQME